MKSMETETTRFTLTDDGILVGRAINPGTVRTAENIADALESLERFLDGQRRPGLWDPRTVRRFSAEAWLAMIGRLGKSLDALAILVDDRISGSIGAFPDAMDSMLMPVRVFQDETEAMDWLRQFLDPV